MEAHLQKVQEHARKKLKKAKDSSHADAIEIYKKFLKIESHRLLLLHKQSKSGLDVARKRSNLMSILLKIIFENAMDKAATKFEVRSQDIPIALIAIGGFGRGELNPYSDIDIHFLYNRFRKKTRIQNYITDVVEQVLYLLWDIGLKVGHASRTLEELVNQANSDMQTLTSLLEARLLAGSEVLFQEFERRYERLCLKGKENKYLQWRIQDQKERHAKFDNTPFLQEPNTKNGCGGLRDYQNLLWMARVKTGTNCSVKELHKMGFITLTERKTLQAAYDFVMRIRTQIHIIEGRASDVLTLPLQGIVAKKLHYNERHILRKVEALMRDYYQHTRNLFYSSNLLARRLAGQPPKGIEQALLSLIPGSVRKLEDIGPFYIEQHELHAKSADIFREDPSRLLQAFQIIQHHNYELGAELQQLITEQAKLFNRRILYKASTQETFLNILGNKGKVGRILKLMHRTGMLAKVVPEFAPLTCLVQHEFYHLYTADEHTLVAIEQLDKVIGSADRPFSDYQSLFVKTAYPNILYLAILLHDTGKASLAKNHSEASAQNAIRLARRYKINGSTLKTLTFLVDHHGTLSETAQRRNLDDHQTILDFARIVQTQERLDLLMLLTFSDGMGVRGEQEWSNWKETLVWHLYKRTSQMLEGENEFIEKAALHRAKVRTRIRDHVPKSINDGELLSHFYLIPDTALNHANPKTIARHIQGVHTFIERFLNSDKDLLRPEILWTPRPHQGHTEVILVAWNTPRLFSRISGALAIAGLDILSADILTRQDEVVIDTFSVCTDQKQAVTHAIDFKNFEETVTAILANPEYAIDEPIQKARNKASYKRPDGLLIATKIDIDNYTSEKYSLLNIQTPNHVGLLYEITKTLADYELDIEHARVMTYKGAALDTFYLTHKGTSKKILNSKMKQNIIQDLTRNLSPTKGPTIHV
ncbi:MAG: [protein-PII] uridylyltransferase [Verrucomicrobiota bacterium]